MEQQGQKTAMGNHNTTLKEPEKIWENFVETALATLRNAYFKPFYLSALRVEGKKPSSEGSRTRAASSQSY